MTVDQCLEASKVKNMVDFLRELSAGIGEFAKDKTKSIDKFLRELSAGIGEFSQGKAKSIDDFLSGLEAERQEFLRDKAEKDRETAGEFSPFRYINLDENKSSDILADLLNPAGKHGQGRIFLDGFLGLCGLPKDFFPEQAYISAEREAKTYSIARPQRSMDILIKGPKTALAVENKLGAVDQDLQVLHYLEHLEKIAPVPKGFSPASFFCLVYLAPAGKTVSEGSLPAEYQAKFAGSFRPVTWQDLLKRFSQCQEQVAAPRMRFFLDAFINAMSEKTA